MNLSIIPNTLSILRMILTFPVVIAIIKEYYSLAIILFILAGITDILDGWIAKSFSMQTRFGSIIDPLADKFFLTLTFTSLLFIGLLPLWLFLIIFMRDLTLIAASVGYYIGKDHSKNDFINPTWISKLNTFLQIFLAFFLILTQIKEGTDIWINILFIVIATSTVVSGLDYYWLWSKEFMLKEKKK